MSRPHPAQLRLLALLAHAPGGRFLDLISIDQSEQVRLGDDLFIPSLVARGWAEMGPPDRPSVRTTAAGRDALANHVGPTGTVFRSVREGDDE